MSFQAVRWAYYDAPHLHTSTGLPDVTARQVLGVLAEAADEHGANAYPSPLRIRYATGLDVRTIDRALKRLENAGLIARDGVVHTGTVRWKLAMSIVRPASEWDELRAEADQAREGESARRKQRRHRQASTDSVHVRDAESGHPAFQIPASGISNPDVRHPVPPEQYLEPPLNHPGTTPGGTLPPDPPRPEAPSGLRLDTSALSAPPDASPDQQGDHRPRARAEPDETAPLAVGESLEATIDATGAVIAVTRTTAAVWRVTATKLGKTLYDATSHPDEASARALAGSYREELAQVRTGRQLSKSTITATRVGPDRDIGHAA